MEQLNDLELELLQGLILKYPFLKSHLPYLQVKDRTVTKTGLTVDFEYLNFDEAITFEEINALFSAAENIEIKGLKQGLGYVIDITDGKISYLEFVTYGETWNGKIGAYKIVKA